MKPGDKFGWRIKIGDKEIYRIFTVISRGINKVGSDAVLFGDDEGEPMGTGIHDELVDSKHFIALDDLNEDGL